MPYIFHLNEFLLRKKQPASINTIDSAMMASNETIPPFEMEFRIRPEDIDRLGHVGNLVYMRWVQDIAIAHWNSAASPAELDKLAWVVVRHEIDYKHSALPGDAILARTWVGTSFGQLFERRTEIFRAIDRFLLASARTLWCPVSAKTGKPTRVSDELRKRFSVRECA